MALRWDCDAAVFPFTVPPQGHYSIYQVGMSYGAARPEEYLGSIALAQDQLRIHLVTLYHRTAEDIASLIVVEWLGHYVRPR
jgi:hypothetical protein